MRQTTVKALSVGAKRKIFYSGDTVRESDFYAGDFDKRIADGHLNADTKEVKSNVPIEDNPEIEVSEKPKGPIVAGAIESPQLEPIEGATLDPPGDGDGPTLTVADIKKDLDARGIKYAANAKKEDLLKLLAAGNN